MSSPPRAAAALSLTGRYAHPGRQAAAGLAAWAEWAGVPLTIEDDRSEPARTGRLVAALARRVDLLLGPYGSGPARAAGEALAGQRFVLWNHGGAAVRPTEARMVDILAPAERYWAGLAGVLAADGADLHRVAVVLAPTGFGRATAAGAVASLAAAGARPLAELAIGPHGPVAAAGAALAAGAQTVIGCGRIEDDLALGRELAGRGVRVGLVVCGIALAGTELGDAVEGWLGAAQWLAGSGPASPAPLPKGVDYPAAQAMAGGLVARAALAAAGTADPDALWDAARALRLDTFLGPFRVDAQGRQQGHAPAIVRWVRRGADLGREVVWRP